MSAEKAAFYEYHSCLNGAVDAAAICFTDGVQIGACWIATVCGPCANPDQRWPGGHGVGDRRARLAEKIVQKAASSPGACSCGYCAEAHRA